MSDVVSYLVLPRGREQIEQIVGCRTVDGACVVHQPRLSEPRRAGCPFVDALLLEGAPADPPATWKGDLAC